jgi:hypothetical protein
VAQVVECLNSKCKALSSKHSKRKRERETDRQRKGGRKEGRKKERENRYCWGCGEIGALVHCR